MGKSVKNSEGALYSSSVTRRKEGASQVHHFFFLLAAPLASAAAAAPDLLLLRVSASLQKKRVDNTVEEQLSGQRFSDIVSHKACCVCWIPYRQVSVHSLCFV